MTSLSRELEPWDFQGFPLPEQNWHRIPNEWVIVRARLARRRELATVVLLEYILRHTWGYAEYGQPKRITMDEFVNGRKRSDGSRMDEGTGLSERAIRDSIKVATDLNLLIVDVDDTDKARVKRSFCLRMIESTEEERQSLPDGGQTLPPYPDSLPPRAAQNAPRSEKELEKEPKERREGVSLISNADPRQERDDEMWEQLRLLGIPDRPSYIRLVGRGLFDDPIQTVEFARRKLAEKQRRA